MTLLVRLRHNNGSGDGNIGSGVPGRVLANANKERAAKAMAEAKSAGLQDKTGVDAVKKAIQKLTRAKYHNHQGASFHRDGRHCSLSRRV